MFAISGFTSTSLCRETWNAAWMCGYAAALSIPLSSGRSQRCSWRSVVYAIRYPSYFRSVEVLNSVFVGCSRRGSFSVFRKICPPMTLWTKVIYMSWTWGWKSLDTLGLWKTLILSAIRFSFSVVINAYTVFIRFSALPQISALPRISAPFESKFW